MKNTPKGERLRLRKRGGGALGTYARGAAALVLAVCLAWSGALGAAAARAEYEGPGWPTAEDAATAYLEGLRSGDLSRMIGAFAVESFVDNHDIAKRVAWLMAFIPAVVSNSFLPGQNETSQAMNVELRKSEVFMEIFIQYLNLLRPDLEIGRAVAFSRENADAEIAAFLAEFDAQGLESSMQNLEMTGFAPPETLHALYADEMFRQRMDSQREVCGADELTSVVAGFVLEGEAYYLCCDAVRYGESWYLLTINGQLGTLLGIPRQSGGIIPQRDAGSETP